MKTLILIAVILVSGCGSESDTKYEHTVQFMAVENCTGLTAKYNPEITIIPSSEWGHNSAAWFQAPNQITIQQWRENDPDLIEHEMIHYLIYQNYGFVDGDHASPLFKQCAPFVNT